MLATESPVLWRGTCWTSGCTLPEFKCKFKIALLAVVLWWVSYGFLNGTAPKGFSLSYDLKPGLMAKHWSKVFRALISQQLTVIWNIRLNMFNTWKLSQRPSFLSILQVCSSSLQWNHFPFMMRPTHCSSTTSQRCSWKARHTHTHTHPASVAISAAL